MNKTSLNLIRIGRAVLGFLAIYSSLLVLSDLFLYFDGYHALKIGLLLVRITIAGLSWAILYQQKEQFKEIKSNIENKNTKKGMRLFFSYLFASLFLGFILLVVFPTITGVYEHNVIEQRS